MYRFLFIALVGLVGATVFATDEDKAIDARVERRVAHLAGQLDLEDAQKAQLTAILTEDERAVAARREALRGDPEAIREWRREHRGEVDRRIDAILTPDQQTRFADLRASRPEDPRLMEMQERLNLSGEQVSAIAPIMERTRERMDELRDGPRGREMFEAMRNLRESEQRAVMAQLDDGQKKEYEKIIEEQREAMRDRRGGRRGGGRPGGGRW